MIGLENWIASSSLGITVVHIYVNKFLNKICCPYHGCIYFQVWAHGIGQSFMWLMPGEDIKLTSQHISKEMKVQERKVLVRMEVKLINKMAYMIDERPYIITYNKIPS